MSLHSDPTESHPWARSRSGPSPGKGKRAWGSRGDQNLGQRGETGGAEKEKAGESSWARPEQMGRKRTANGELLWLKPLALLTWTNGSVCSSPHPCSVYSTISQRDLLSTEVHSHSSSAPNTDRAPIALPSEYKFPQTPTGPVWTGKQCPCLDHVPRSSTLADWTRIPALPCASCVTLTEVTKPLCALVFPSVKGGNKGSL